jgi:hypothetical protein
MSDKEIKGHMDKEISDVGLTREAWLTAAINYFVPRFEEIGLPLPTDDEGHVKIHVSIGFGYGVRAESKYILGQTWATVMSEDGINHLFIGPMEATAVEVLVTLLHELIHVADDVKSGHRGAFAEAATRLGFEGPMTQTPPSIQLTAELMTLAAALGPYPGEGSKLDVDKIKAPVPLPVPGQPGITVRPPKVHTGPAKQSTRMVKAICLEAHEDEALNGYTVRTTRKWIAAGVPKCPAGHDMFIDL